VHGGASPQLPTDSDWKQLSETVFDLDCTVISLAELLEQADGDLFPFISLFA